MQRATLLVLTLALGCNSGKIESPDAYLDGLTDEDGDDSDGNDGDGPGDEPDWGDGDRPDDDRPDDGDDNRPDEDDNWPDDDEWDDGWDDDDWGGAEYYGEVQMYLVDRRGEYQDFCYGENAWWISDDSTQGEAWCEIYRGGRAGEYLYLDYAGERYRDGEIYGEVWVYRSWSDNWDRLEWQAFAYDEGREGYIESWASGWVETNDGGRQMDAYGWGYRY